jgi:anti-sigma regulatory factor (Ser/Thr protein kinase)
MNRDDFIDELDIYQEKIFPFTEKLPRNVEKIWAYAFCEMMNNVIDHSQASQVCFFIGLTEVDTSIVLIDNGIGAFRNIMEKFEMASLDQAIQGLFKGKLTTDPEHHSGEGIFFSSRMMDEFAVVSSGKVFSHSKYETIASSLNSIKELKGWDNLPGTIVFMKLSNYSKREIGEVFRAYEDDDYDFIRTIIPVKNLFDSFPVSRSQAKRLCKGFERFKEVILDFHDVERAGQGFVDELFRVYVNHNPDVKISYINACDEVKRMIRHVESRTF